MLLNKDADRTLLAFISQACTYSWLIVYNICTRNTTSYIRV